MALDTLGEIRRRAGGIVSLFDTPPEPGMQGWAAAGLYPGVGAAVAQPEAGSARGVLTAGHVALVVIAALVLGIVAFNVSVRGLKA